MNRNRNHSTLDPSPQLLQQDRHLHFATQQSAIKRVNSLRKVHSQQPSFQPQIHQLPFQIYPQRTKTEVSRQQLIERLIENGREKAESLRAQKLRKQEKDGEKYTFQPSINAQSKKITEKDSKYDCKIYQRLYEEGLTKMRSVEQYASLSCEDKENCTFQPNIGNKSKDKSVILPIYQRLQEIIAQKRQNAKRLEVETESKLKEKPTINYKSKQIVQQKAEFKKNVLQRLFGHLKDKNNRLQKLVQQKQIAIDQQCTFQPNINYQSDSIMEVNFLERQQIEAVKVKQKVRGLMKQEEASFKPIINKLSNLLIEAEREGQSQAEKIERLHCQPLIERKMQIEKMQEHIYRQCTFQPQINAISKALQGQPHSHKCSCAPTEEQYHFHPEINPKSRVLANKAKPKQVGIAVEQARLQLEYKQMKECTFKPKTLGVSYKTGLQKMSVKEVAGVEHYQQRLERMKSMKMEEEALKQKLFQLEKGYEKRQFTKCQPFKLSSKQPKIVKLKQAADEQFRKLHPFRPTMASMR